jgi:hypothetical protein
MPFLAPLAARRIATSGSRLIERGLLVWPVLIAVGLGLVQSALWLRAWNAGSAGALSHWPVADWISPCILFGLAAGVYGAAAFAWKGNWSATIVLCSGLGMVYGALRNIDSALWSNVDQVLTLENVNRQVPSEGRVLDGFTGYGALRPHAWYYWWINEYSLALIPAGEKARLLEELQHRPPAAVLFDRNVELLPPAVVEWIRSEYAPSDPPVLWLPRQESTP